MADRDNSQPTNGGVFDTQQIDTTSLELAPLPAASSPCEHAELPKAELVPLEVAEVLSYAGALYRFGALGFVPTTRLTAENVIEATRRGLKLRQGVERQEVVDSVKEAGWDSEEETLLDFVSRLQGVSTQFDRAYGYLAVAIPELTSVVLGRTNYWYEKREDGTLSKQTPQWAAEHVEGTEVLMKDYREAVASGRYQAKFQPSEQSLLEGDRVGASQEFCYLVKLLADGTDKLRAESETILADYLPGLEEGVRRMQLIDPSLLILAGCFAEIGLSNRSY